MKNKIIKNKRVPILQNTNYRDNEYDPYHTHGLNNINTNIPTENIFKKLLNIGLSSIADCMPSLTDYLSDIIAKITPHK